MIRTTLFFLLLSVVTTQLYAQQMDGDPKSYEKSVFLGLDEVGDCLAETGDLTSAFIKSEGDHSILRLSFDNMVTRKHNQVNKDHFEGKQVQVNIKLENPFKKILFEELISISQLSGKSISADYLRTPENNMIEIAFKTKEFPLTNSVIALEIIINNQVVDTFNAKSSGTKDSGNCAFVHHGNQGLTYTEVFYGSPSGTSGLEGSGFDEVLEVHEATSIPGNFHMSGTLMPAAEWHNPEFNDWLETMASSGLASMMTSALGQHIMPFLTNDMNEWSVYTETQMVEYMYNYTPRVAWIPERVWLAQGYYPDAGVIDWLGDNWAQHGVWGVVLDDGPHLNGYDNRKIHWMNNGSGIDLRVIPINNSFVGNMHYDAGAAKNQIASMGQYNICVYGTDWEVAAEMNEHDGTFFLDNYEDVLWYCHDNYPGINVWKLEDAIQNTDFNGTGANITKGTYGLLGGTGGYGGSNNSWYINWASTPSHSDFHDPKWDYGTVWSNTYNFLTSVNSNSLSELAWYTMMINLHETGWHSGGEIADWEHRYSSHIKNANVYTEASRWADGQYTETTGCFFMDIDKDGIDELIMHNEKVYMVFEEIGGKANWIFYKNGLGGAFSVVGSDVAYWSETDGDYNESSNNHVAALSDVSPNQQNSVYNMTILQSSGSTVSAILDQWGVEKTLTLETGNDYLDVEYNFFNQTGYIKSGWTPDLLSLIWSGKSNLERIWGSGGSYCGYRNSASGATAALVLGNGGANHNFEFEGTLVKGDEIYGYNQFLVKLYAGYTSSPAGSEVPELDLLASENMDVFPPVPGSPVSLVSDNEVLIAFSEAVDQTTAENISNYSLSGFSNSYTLVSATRQANWNNVVVQIAETFVPGDAGQINISNVEDLNGNAVATNTPVDLFVPNGFTPHTIIIDGTNDFITESELMEQQSRSLFLTWDNTNLYIGFQFMDLGTEGDLFVNIDTDQTPGSGATSGSWAGVDFVDPYLPEYQVAIEQGFGEQFNIWNGSGWDYGAGFPGSTYTGWSDNGLTEMQIPWSSLGDPAGVAISVHTTNEDVSLVTEVFPSINPTGNQPTITHFYAFFTPYIAGNMPQSGSSPNDATIVPNTPVQISSYLPADLNQKLLANTSLEFSVVADDLENDPVVYTWLLDGNPVASSPAYTFSPDDNLVGNHTLQLSATDNVPGNAPAEVTWQVEVIEASLILNLKVFLEGPFSGTNMHTLLNDKDLIPLSQPFNTSPWNYSGTEQVLSIPGIDVVDWILVELRDANSASEAYSSTTIAQAAAFLTSDGTVIGIDGNEDLKFGVTVDNNLYVVVRHRDHLDIISSGSPTESEGVLSYDFSSASDRVLGGLLGHKELTAGVYGMYGGDADANGTVNDLDRTSLWEIQAGTSGYLQSDFSLDSDVNNIDKNDIWLPNLGKGTQIIEGSKDGLNSQVPK